MNPALQIQSPAAEIFADRPRKHAGCEVRVQLVTLGLPNDGTPKWGGSHPFLVAVASDHHRVNGEKTWSWASVTSSQKEAIGYEMLEMGCKPDCWYWCYVFPSPVGLTCTVCGTEAPVEYFQDVICTHCAEAADMQETL